MSALEREIPVSEPQHLDLSLRNVFEEGGRAVPCLGRARPGVTENDPSHDESGHLSGEAQDRAATADLDIVRVRTQAKQL